MSCCGVRNPLTGGFADWLGLGDIIGQSGADFLGDLATTAATTAVKGELGSLLAPGQKTGGSNSDALLQLYLQSQPRTTLQTGNSLVSPTLTTPTPPAPSAQPAWVYPVLAGAGVLVVLLVVMRK